MPSSLGRGFSVDIDKYYLALGRFITNFSKVENYLLRLVRMEAGLTPQIAPALLSSLRIMQAIDALRRVHEAKGTAIDTQLKRALDQLANINTARNWIVHWGVDFTDPLAPVVSNKGLAHNAESLRQIPVSVETIHDMTYDLGQLSFLFQAHLNPEWDSKGAKAEARTWLYKFPHSKDSPAKTPKKL